MRSILRDALTFLAAPYLAVRAASPQPLARVPGLLLTIGAEAVPAASAEDEAVPEAEPGALVGPLGPVDRTGGSTEGPAPGKISL